MCFCRFLTYHRCWHICICCTRTTDGLPLWFKGKQMNNIQTLQNKFFIEHNMFFSVFSIINFHYYHLFYDFLNNCESKLVFFLSQSDMYSIGVLALELFQPFGTEMERVRTLGNLREGKIPDSFCQRWPVLTKYIMKLTCKEPSVRPTASQLLQSELFCSKDIVCSSWIDHSSINN